MPPGFVTKLTKHETPDFLETVRRDPFRQVDAQKYLGEAALAQICFKAGFTKLVEAEPCSATRPSISLEKIGTRNSCREYTKPRDEVCAEPKGVIGDNTRIGPIRDMLVTRQYGPYGVQVLIDSLAHDLSKSWVFISRGVERYVTELSTKRTHPCTLTSVQTVRGDPQRTWRNGHNQVPHLTALGRTGIFLSISGNGSISFVWIK